MPTSEKVRVPVYVVEPAAPLSTVPSVLVLFPVLLVRRSLSAVNVALKSAEVGVKEAHHSPKECS